MLSAREDVYGAIFTLLSTTPGFASYWRRFLPQPILATAQKPALMMREKCETLVANFGMPAKYHIIIELLLVVQTPMTMGDSIPASQINPLIDAIEATLAPVNQGDSDLVLGRITLGNVNISRIWIEGNVEIIEAITEDVSYVIIPLNVIAV